MCVRTHQVLATKVRAKMHETRTKARISRSTTPSRSLANPLSLQNFRLNAPRADTRNCSEYFTLLQGRELQAQDGFNPSTRIMINKYLKGKTQLLYPEPKDVFPAELIKTHR